MRPIGRILSVLSVGRCGARLQKYMPANWRERATQLKREVYAMVYAARDPRVPWYAKALALAVVAYALSPIDLIPDFIPVLGYLDDLLILPAGVLAVRALIPAQVMAECRARAALSRNHGDRDVAR